MVQVAAPGGAALADAVVHAPLLGEHGTPGGTPHHDICIFCQLLGQHAVASSAAVQAGPHAEIGYIEPIPPTAPVREAVLHHPDSRAPPLS